jgi:Tfp pilus assembly protein PilV
MNMITQNNQRGFTLLEVVGAILVFAFGILAVTRLQIGSVRSNTFSNDLSAATNLAQDKMEELMSWPYASTDPLKELVDKNGDGVAGLNSETAATADYFQTQVYQLRQYSLSWNIVGNYPVGPPDTMERTKTIRMIVTWRDSKNTLHRLVLDSVKADHG